MSNDLITPPPTCSIAIGTPGATARVRVEIVAAGQGTAVYFDGVKQNLCVSIRMNVEATDRPELEFSCLRTAKHEPDTDFLEYLKACGFSVMVRDLGMRSVREYPNDGNSCGFPEGMPPK